MNIPLFKSICLRCGFCCFNWGVGNVPGYEDDKPEKELCKHCKTAELKQGQWSLASCAIHNSPDYPEGCIHFGLGKPCCVVGLTQWNQKLENYPDSKVPEEIQKYLERKNK